LPSPSFPSLVPYGWNDRWLALLSEHGADVEPGRVLRHNGSALQVVAPDGTRSAPLGPTLDPPPVVGDWVVLDSDTPVAVLARTSLLRRRTAIGEHEHPLVANIDAVLIVCGLDRPVKAGRIQRVAALAWDAGAVPAVVLTKADLVDDASHVIEEVTAGNPGITVTAVSTRTGHGLDALRASLTDTTATMIGESGAGKSSLVNALTDEASVATGAVREGDAKGRHTTTARSLHLLRDGGVLVDTPGIRAVGLWVDPDAVTATFADVDTIAESCRFNDCQHEDQPGCAVRVAVDGGELDQERLTAWRALRREAAAAARRADAQAQRSHERRFSRAGRAAQRRKNRPG
jgi:ribosome biogenesis GTPase